MVLRVTKIGAFQEMRGSSRPPYIAFVAPSSILNPAARVWSHTIGGSRLSKTVAFLAQWGGQAAALGWTAHDLFGLAQPPARPHPSYRRLSRYDETGLIWLLCGREVVALTETTAVIRSSTGAITIYRRHYKPALGPVGDSLEDLVPPFGGNDVSGAPSVRGALAAMTDKQTSR